MQRKWKSLRSVWKERKAGGKKLWGLDRRSHLNLKSNQNIVKETRTAHQEKKETKKKKGRNSGRSPPRGKPYPKLRRGKSGKTNPKHHKCVPFAIKKTKGGQLK